MSLRNTFRFIVLSLTAVVVNGEMCAQQLMLVTTNASTELQENTQQVLNLLAEVDSDKAEALRVRVAQAVGNENLPAGICAAIQQVLDEACLLEVAINPESRVKVSPGPASRALTKGEWASHLVKVHNQAGVTAPLRASTPQAYEEGIGQQRDAWLEIELRNSDELSYELTGATLEYRLIALRSHATGFRSAVIAMDVGQGTADIGFRNDTLLTFRCTPPSKTSSD